MKILRVCFLAHSSHSEIRIHQEISECCLLSAVYNNILRRHNQIILLLSVYCFWNAIFRICIVKVLSHNINCKT